MKFDFNFVKSYYEEQGCELLETEYIDSDTNMRYICKCGNESKMKFGHFKDGHRCKKCGNKKISEKRRLKYNFVYNFFIQNDCELLETNYINAKTKMKYKCECGNISFINYDKFRSGQRCYDCRNKKISNANSQYTGDKTSGWNMNRSEVEIKNKIRSNKSYNWVVKHMKDDPLYSNFILNKSDYNIDHKIPLGIFSKIIVEYNLNPDEIKNIINKRENLQILTKKDNNLKRDKGCIFQACQYLMLNKIKLIKGI